MSYKLIPSEGSNGSVSIDASGNLIYTDNSGTSSNLIPKSLNDLAVDLNDFSNPIPVLLLKNLTAQLNNINSKKLSGITLSNAKYGDTALTGVTGTDTELDPDSIDPNVSWNAINVLFNYFRDLIPNRLILDLTCYCRNGFIIKGDDYNIVSSYNQVMITVKYVTKSSIGVDTVIIDFDSNGDITRSYSRDQHRLSLIDSKSDSTMTIYSTPKYFSTQLMISRIEFIKLDKDLEDQLDIDRVPVLGDDYNYALIVDDNNTALCIKT